MPCMVEKRESDRDDQITNNLIAAAQIVIHPDKNAKTPSLDNSIENIVQSQDERNKSRGTM